MAAPEALHNLNKKLLFAPENPPLSDCSDGEAPWTVPILKSSWMLWNNRWPPWKSAGTCEKEFPSASSPCDNQELATKKKAGRKKKARVQQACKAQQERDVDGSSLCESQSSSNPISSVFQQPTQERGFGG